jgi:hypothetical protein
MTTIWYRTASCGSTPPRICPVIIPDRGQLKRTPEVVQNRTLKERRLLGHIADRGAPLRGRKGKPLAASQPDVAPGPRLQAGQDAEQGAFAPSRGAAHQHYPSPVDRPGTDRGPGPGPGPGPHAERQPGELKPERHLSPPGHKSRIGDYPFLRI